MEPYYADDLATLYHGDCREVMAQLPDASVDAIVTDPPYGLEFMGKDWDAPWKGKASREFNEIEPGSLGGFRSLPNHARVNNLKCEACDRWKFSSNPCRCKKPSFPPARQQAMVAYQEWFTEFACEALRVLKPGGHILAFGGTRTWHRLAVAIEDAGFDIRDSIAWMYGSGFPKSLDVSKAIDKGAGHWRGRAGQVQSPNGAMSGANYERTDKGTPITSDAANWQGWGTALKPAFEPVVVARKPLIGTVAENVLEHGTGALNIDGCRIPSDDGYEKAWDKPVSTSSANVVLGNLVGDGRKFVDLSANKPTGGRWPANVILDEDQAAALDQQSGVTTSQGGQHSGRSGTRSEVGAFGYNRQEIKRPTDTGGASRFFYVPKANRRERPTADGVAHPTVKPLALMTYLIRLVTPPGGIVLDPFAGSGTTLEAATVEGFRSIGIELTPEYLPLIEQRLRRNIQPTLGTAS